MVYDFRSSRQPLSTNFCLSISFSLRQRRGAEWTSGGAGWRGSGLEHGVYRSYSPDSISLV